MEGSPAAADEALRLITNKLREASARVQQPSQPRSARPVSHEDQHTVTLLVSNDHVGGIIGKGGANIMQIRQVTPLAFGACICIRG